MGVLAGAGLSFAQTRIVRADLSHTNGPHTSVPFRCIGAGRANEGLRADWQQQLATVQQELGFDYIRMHGILHDEGGIGLMNLEGVRKPSYFAYRFLRQLGEQDVETNDPQSWVTRSSDGRVQALMWDYTPIVPPAGQTDQSFCRKELPSADKGTLRIQLDQLPAGRYQVSTCAIGYERNDAYTAYLHMGAPSQLAQSQVKALDKIASGAPLEQSVIDHPGGAFVREMALRENDVFLVVLNRL